MKSIRILLEVKRKFYYCHHLAKFIVVPTWLLSTDRNFEFNPILSDTQGEIIILLEEILQGHKFLLQISDEYNIVSTVSLLRESCMGFARQNKQEIIYLAKPDQHLLQNTGRAFQLQHQQKHLSTAKPLQPTQADSRMSVVSLMNKLSKHFYLIWDSIVHCMIYFLHLFRKAHIPTVKSIGNYFLVHDCQVYPFGTRERMKDKWEELNTQM